ncbi:hypothetical protein M434DRAFT_209266 [Hypoxylon sp. CO27-5]|nr:hypothetical protein M434DRAFT_209266 [Hypoxylon sp. CO27-5]
MRRGQVSINLSISLPLFLSSVNGRHGCHGCHGCHVRHRHHPLSSYPFGYPSYEGFHPGGLARLTVSIGGLEKVTHYTYASATFLGSSRPSYISAPIRADPMFVGLGPADPLLCRICSCVPCTFGFSCSDSSFKCCCSGL